jgi:hypothetical protein
METIFKTLVAIAGVVLLGFITAIFIGLLVMWLWNWLMPVIFNLPTISYVQAYGLTVLFQLLIGTSVSGH